MFIKFEDAIQIVLDLAKQNVMKQWDIDNKQMLQEYQKQREACRVIEDYITYHMFKE